MSKELVPALIGFLVGLLFVAIILKATKTDGSIQCKYDERQKAARGKAYMLGFYTLMGYDLFYGLCGMIFEKMIIDTFAAMVLGIILAVMVQVSYCIWHDAYFSLNENKRKIMWIFGVLGVLNLIPGVVSVIAEGLIVKGALNPRCINLLCACLFIYIFVLYALKMSHNKKEEEL